MSCIDHYTSDCLSHLYIAACRIYGGFPPHKGKQAAIRPWTPTAAYTGICSFSLSCASLFTIYIRPDFPLKLPVQGIHLKFSACQYFRASVPTIRFPSLHSRSLVPSLMSQHRKQSDSMPQAYRSPASIQPRRQYSLPSSHPALPQWILHPPPISDR